ncbi:hypothetical protein BT96DRAFT_1024582 [Gymnopus androsaceus JB14]|uniref:Uncharacterized protein n=1 Tax=Gymnopus androsaceus JB14 TaxID=1447944 RepID=A0A6A4GXB0_9AGAR|nr:hypothetical protein BT96DRAFT_1024582 [Gymnopus androsaceus JB14]
MFVPILLASVAVTAAFGIITKFTGYSEFLARHEQAYKEHREDMKKLSDLWYEIPDKEVSQEEKGTYVKLFERAQHTKEAHQSLLHQDWRIFEKYFRRNELREKKREAQKAIEELRDYVTPLWDRWTRNSR